jgi:small-conductance mechanosensitive channel
MVEKLLNSIEYIGLFIGVMLLTVLVAFLVSRFFRRLIRRSTEAMDNDPTNYHFLRHAITGLIYVVGFSIAIYKVPDLRALASSLLAGAGILAVAVGFAAQSALSNIISGLFIVIFKPFRVKDRIRVRDLQGIIEDITLRHTIIRDFENRRIIIPNAVISDEVIVNADFGDDKICKFVEIGISFDSDIKLARRIMKAEILSHPLHIDPRSPQQIENDEELAPVRVLTLTDSSVLLRGYAWAKDSADAFRMGCDLLESIKERFDREGVEIPFPYRTLVYKEQRPHPASETDRPI